MNARPEPARTADVSGAARSYVRLLDGSRRPAFAFVHPVGGSVSGYVDVLADLPSDAECVGLRARGLHPEGKPHRDIPAMAQQYLTELLAHHDPGQLVLGGYSFGGLVAWEMARLLRSRGRPPAGVVLLGTAVPRRNVPRAEHVDTFRQLVSAIYRVPAGQLELDGLDDEEMVRSAARTAERCDTLPVQYRNDDLERLFRVLALNLTMAHRYRVPPYDGTVHLVRPDRPDLQDTRRAWQELCPGGLVTHDIGGPHNSLMSGTYGTRIAEFLAARWPDNATTSPHGNGANHD
ncbi:thioesterase domain-containing protein [Streptomyces avermitilis]|uniref:thioesterase domain-containing protein n=1 Tax=Streptomyces avermitilis TaxID=33903 RepID=UPI0033B9E8F8